MEEISNELFKKGCLIVINSRFWGASKKLEKDQIGNLPPEIVKATFDLLADRSRLDHIKSIMSEAKRFVSIYSMDFPIRSVKFVRKNNTVMIDNYLKTAKGRVLDGLENLLDEIDYLKDDFHEKFPQYYKESNYPTREQLRANLVFDWQFILIGLPDKGSGILSPEIYEQELAKTKRNFKDFNDSLISTVAKEFYERIDKLREQCITGSINTATVKSIHNVLDKFSNVWDGCFIQEDLQKMISGIKEYMDGTDGDMLRASDDLRKMVGDKMSEIVSEIKLSDDERILREIDF